MCNGIRQRHTSQRQRHAIPSHQAKEAELRRHPCNSVCPFLPYLLIPSQNLPNGATILWPEGSENGIYPTWRRVQNVRKWLFGRNSNCAVSAPKPRRERFPLTRSLALFLTIGTIVSFNAAPVRDGGYAFWTLAALGKGVEGWARLWNLRT